MFARHSLVDPYRLARIRRGALEDPSRVQEPLYEKIPDSLLRPIATALETDQSLTRKRQRACRCNAVGLRKRARWHYILTMDTQIDPIATASSLVWLACAIICILKGKLGMAIIGFMAAIAIAVWTLPPIGGYYILNILYPISFIPIWGGQYDLRIRNRIGPTGFTGRTKTNTCAPC